MRTPDRKTSASAAQQNQQRMSRWVLELWAQVKEHRGDLNAADADSQARIARRLLDAESTLDLVRQGLRPGETRQFDAPITLTVRCVSKGHVLGHVYTTRFSPVFVPTVSDLSSLQAPGQKGGRDGWVMWDSADPIPLQVLSPDFLADRPEMADDEQAMWVACRCSADQALRLDRLKAALDHHESLITV